MSEDRWDSMQEELNRLKREVRRKSRTARIERWVLFGLLAFVVVPAVSRAEFFQFLETGKQGKSFEAFFADLAAQRPAATKQVTDVIQARSFQVVNANGSIVAVLASDSAGDGVLALTHPSGRPQALIAVDESGEGLVSVLNQLGNEVITMSVDINGSGILQISNNQGSLATQAGYSTRGGFIGIGNAQGVGVAAVSVDTMSSGRLSLANTAGTVVAEGYVESGGNGLFQTKQAGETVIWNSNQTGSNSGSSTLLGDLDNDGDVDFTDFVTFAANFGKTGPG